MTKYEVELTDEQAEAHMADCPETLGDYGTDPGIRARIALADAIRANPPKRPRMIEPGWGEKVTASVYKDSRCEWVNAYHGRDVGNVWTNAQGFHAAWSDLIDPQLIREDAGS